MQKISIEKHEAFKEILATINIMGQGLTFEAIKKELEIRLSYPVDERSNIELDLEKITETRNIIRQATEDYEKYVRVINGIPEKCEEAQEAIKKFADLGKSFEFLTI